MLETRFDLTGWSIDFNPFEVPALKRRAVAFMKTLGETQSVSTNEARRSGGFEDVPEGNEIVVASGKTTLTSIVTAPSFLVGDDTSI
jgi:hypothetical protein